MTNIIDALNWRYAVKKFDSKIIPQEKLEIILESLRLTPSSLGLQAWKFILVKNQETRKKLLPASMNQNQVVEASHLLVLARTANFSGKDTKKWAEFLAKEHQMPSDKKDGYLTMVDSYLSSVSEDQKKIWLDKQLYIALGNLMITCAIEGIDTCPMEGFNPQEYDRILGLEDKGLKSVLVCPLGYRAADDPYQNKSKARYPKEEIFLEI
ncbi:MAG: NAD(P)H-dependent oxidoreductase [Bacteroidales bacterium]|nr:NAD(P)H-dependent oxidoreductase [Bacteroidales bacterium]